MELSEDDAGAWRALVRSEKMEKWIAEIRTSSSLIAKPINCNEWRDLMLFFRNGDVSGIKHLKLSIDEWPEPSKYELDGLDESRGFGFVLGAGRFSALKALKIDCGFSELNVVDVIGGDLVPSSGLDLGSESLAGALRTGHFTNLQQLHLRVMRSFDGTFDLNDIFEALIEGRVSRLTSLSIFVDGYNSNADQKFEALLKNQCLRNLTHLAMSSRLSESCIGNICAAGIKAGLLPNVRSLLLEGYSLRDADLVDFVVAPGNWFSSLESLTLACCRISPGQVRAMALAIMNLKERLALQILNLGTNYLDISDIYDLVILVQKGCLTQLREWDLSYTCNIGPGEPLARLMKNIQAGHLPRLEKLNWWGNPSGDEGALAVAQAYLNNVALTADIEIDWFRVSDRSLEVKAKAFKERNARLVALRNQLKELGVMEDTESPEDYPILMAVSAGPQRVRLPQKYIVWESQDYGKLEDVVPVRSAKVFLCGYPRVGKTTLRRALRRRSGIRTKLKWETRPSLFRNEPRTRGIELRSIEDKTNTRITLWDLAGQEEFHVLHSTFLAHLGFGGGKATQFVLVFKVPFEEDVEAKLVYWLKFVASSSMQLVKRPVLIVLNCFNGKYCLESDTTYWMELIQKYAAKFSDILEIHPVVKIVDARVTASVQPLKNQLFAQAQELLQDVKVPKACFKLLKDLKQWSKGKNESHLPIFSWQAFEEHWKSMRTVTGDPSENLKVCASYLHEIGEIIYFDEKESTQPRFGNRRIVVPDPEWFCKQVVGQLLLPIAMLQGDNPLQMSADGTITLIRFRAFFAHMLPHGTESDDVISMLQQVGLCYKQGLEKIVIPGLLREDDYTSLDWEGQGFHGVMGRCLATKDTDRCAIPSSLFRRLQVELAEDPHLGGCGDSDYRAGRSYSNFKLGDLLVLVQFDVDHSDPRDDRIDILVKSVHLEDTTDVRLAKVNCICKIVQKLERLCVTCCPGLRYDIGVIQPWNANEQTIKMRNRELMYLTEIKSLLVMGRDCLGWKLNGGPVEIKTLLSKSELEGVLGAAQRDYEDYKQEAISWGLLTDYSLQQIEGFEQEYGTNVQGLDVEGATTTDDEGEITNSQILNEMRRQHHLTRETVHGEGHLTRQYIQKSYEVLLLEIRSKCSTLAHCIQAQQEFSIEERVRSVPRYIFLSRGPGNSQLVREAFEEFFELHFLCESQFADGLLHEVQGQEGVQLTRPKEWWVKISPWLRRSFQVAVMVGKTVGNIFVPGVLNVIPDFDFLLKGGESSSRTVDTRAATILEEGKVVNQIQGDHRNYGTARAPLDLKERMIAEGVVKDLIGELGEATFKKKIGLIKVLLKAPAQPHVSSSTQAQSPRAPSVRWICKTCYKNYGDRAQAI